MQMVWSCIAIKEFAIPNHDLKHWFMSINEILIHCLNDLEHLVLKSVYGARQWTCLDKLLGEENKMEK